MSILISKLLINLKGPNAWILIGTSRINFLVVITSGYQTLCTAHLPFFVHFNHNRSGSIDLGRGNKLNLLDRNSSN